MWALASGEGTPTSSSLSKRPGRRRAESRASGLLLAAITTTCPLPVMTTQLIVVMVASVLILPASKKRSWTSQAVCKWILIESRQCGGLVEKLSAWFWFCKALLRLAPAVFQCRPGLQQQRHMKSHSLSQCIRERKPRL